MTPDENLYQILPLKYLDSLLEGHLTLVNPTTWGAHPCVGER